jgi:hypothetical protein
LRLQITINTEDINDVQVEVLRPEEVKRPAMPNSPFDTPEGSPKPTADTQREGVDYPTLEQALAQEAAEKEAWRKLEELRNSPGAGYQTKG